VLALFVAGVFAQAPTLAFSKQHRGTPAVQKTKAKKPESTSAAPPNSVPLPERAPPLELRGQPAAPEAPKPETFNGWPTAQVKSAQAACDRLPADHMEFTTLPPIHQGACGTPIPIALKSINLEPRLELRPLARLNCRAAGAVDRWLREVVQPRAWEFLDARIVRIVVMSSYDCRTRADTGKLSEHAFANAIDISEFVTAKGEHVRVTDHWGGNSERARFLKAVHKGACKIFGTVLGPDANAAHRSHFHLDMTPRHYSAFCE
jgi:hypothetical protein